MIGRIVRPRVYLEGFEIPSYKVTVQASVGAPALAVVDCPPLEEFFDRFVEDPKSPGTYIQKMGVAPRTFVHVFYEDSEDPDGVARLLFEGELVKYEYAKVRDQRSIRFYARDISNLLTSVYVRYYSDFFTPYGKTVATFTGQGTKGAQTERLNLSLVALTGINPEVLSALKSDEERGFGIAAAFRNIAFKALTTNVFFQNFDSRTQIRKKIASFVDAESKLLLSAKILEGLIQQNMSSLKESATIWDLYSLLMSLVFYFPAPILAAPFVRNGAQDQGSTGTAFEVLPEKSLPQLLLKPYTWWTSPPNFNVIFPSQYKSFSFSRDFMAEPTRLLMHAFGVVESIEAEKLKTLAPSNYIFVAPSVLNKNFQREAFDTKVQIAGGATVRGFQEQIRGLEEEKRALSAQLAGTNLDAAQKREINTQIAQKDAEIARLQAKLDETIRDAERQVEILSADQAQPKPSPVMGELWNRSVLTAESGVALPSREDLKGIVFAFDYQNQTQVEITKAKGVDAKTVRDYLANVAEYKLTLMQYQNRFADLALYFSPQLVCGFPALVVDPNANLYGEVDSVTHIFDANGQADTQVRLSFVRGEEVEFAETSRNVPGQIGFPVWVNTKYRPDRIGDEIYAKLFPANRLSSSRGGLMAANAISPLHGNTQVQAGRKVRSLFFASKDKDRFALGFTRRNVASVDQVMVEVLGATKVGRNYVLKNVGDDRFQAAQEYAKAANKVSTFARAEAPQEVRV